MRFIISILLSALAVFVAALLVPGIEVDGYLGALIFAVILGLVNATIGLVLKLITAPLNWITLGLVSFVINILMILLVDNFYVGFTANGFWVAALFALVLAIIQSFLGIKD